MARTRRIVILVAGLLFLASQGLLAQEAVKEKKKDAKKPAATKFLRIKRDANEQPLTLETATIRYVPASGEGNLVVDLIGVVHIADKSYYDRLNKQFEEYDVLLYELVAPPGTRIPKGGRKNSDNPVAFLQQMMKTVLNLESQLEHIDYTRKNFVHADLSPEGMAEAMRNRGEDGLTLALSIFADVLRQANVQELKRQQNPAKGGAANDIDIFTLLLDPDAPTKLNRVLAEQLEAMGNLDEGLGKTLSTLLIADRNKEAMRVFAKELAKGKKKIGIFYGAAHMPDFERRLRDEFGLKPDQEKWHVAWDLRSKKGLDGLLDLLK